MVEPKLCSRKSGLRNTTPPVTSPGREECMATASSRIFQGIWGSAPFQRLYGPAPGLLSSLILMPEWFVVVGLLFLLTGLGYGWRPLLLAAPLLLFALGASATHAIASGL